MKLTPQPLPWLRTPEGLVSQPLCFHWGSVWVYNVAPVTEARTIEQKHDKILSLSLAQLL